MDKKIDKEFLEYNGFILNKEYPLCQIYVHSKSDRIRCSIGRKYGHFSMSELHWCNDAVEKEFTTINPNLSKDDYFKIIQLLNINI